MFQLKSTKAGHLSSMPSGSGPDTEVPRALSTMNTDCDQFTDSSDKHEGIKLPVPAAEGNPEVYLARLPARDSRSASSELPVER